MIIINLNLRHIPFNYLLAAISQHLQKTEEGESHQTQTGRLDKSIIVGIIYVIPFK